MTTRGKWMLEPPAHRPPADDPSWWMRDAAAANAGPPAPELSGTADADVCIVGGGYTGLWTALNLLNDSPELRVVIVEAGVCGSGASGRNGGFATTWWNELPAFIRHYGPEQALFLARASSDAIDAIERLGRDEEADVHFRRGGWIQASGAPAQDGVAGAAVRTVQEVGEAGRLVVLDAEEVRRRTGSPVLRNGVLEPGCASVHPALLVAALRRAVLRRGARLFEWSPVSSVDRAARTISTGRGSVRAGKVVIAVNAWAAKLPELRLRVVPLSSQIIMTEPVPEKIAELGWTGGELVTDTRLLLHYTHVTRDGRIAFGRGGGNIGGRGRVTPGVLSDPGLSAQLERDLVRFWPSLRGTRIEAAWGGAVDRSAWHAPFFAPIDDAGHVLVAAGFSGKGVGPCHVGGRILASLALERDDEWATCALVGMPDRLLPPEPIRTLGGRLLRDLVARKERLEEDGRHPDRITRAATSLVWLSMPAPRRPRWLGGSAGEPGKPPHA